MTRHIYSVKYRRADELHLNRLHRITVVASSAAEARAYARIRDPRFHSTVASPKRRGVVEPEQADPITAAKARDDLRDASLTVDWHGHEMEVEWVD